MSALERAWHDLIPDRAAALNGGIVISRKFMNVPNLEESLFRERPEGQDRP
jgi:hypothetical protein